VQVLRLRLHQFRNLDRQEVDFCPGTNLFFGQNGQGKTNLLEAIYMLGYGRSFRTPAPRDCVRHGSDQCSLEGKAEHFGMVRELGVSITSVGEKKLSLHRKPCTLAEFIGNLHVLAFTQEHLKVVRGGPAERRAFLDRAMITVYAGHMQRLAAYGRALKQRNRLLAAAAGRGVRADHDLLDSWDETLVREGSRIISDRRRYVEEMKRELANPFAAGEELEIRYASSAAAEGYDPREIELAFREKLSAARTADERKGFTSAGPHRDDLKLILNNISLADFGSAGQQRSSLLSLYFAQMEIHRRMCGHYPVFLMDDVEAELDDQRLQAFFRHVAQRTQTFLTTAKEKILPPLAADCRRYHVHLGTIAAAA
jgi:DNA replication and repair protein RecF